MRIPKFDALFLLVFYTVLFSTVSAIPDVCKYQGRQMTVGQTLTDCYANITCFSNGVLKIQDPCPSYSCMRPSMFRGYKRFDSRKPYPECCGGPICEDNQFSFYGSVSRTYIPKAFVKRSPHVMGIKFA